MREFLNDYSGYEERIDLPICIRSFYLKRIGNNNEKSEQVAVDDIFKALKSKALKLLQLPGANNQQKAESIINEAERIKNDAKDKSNRYQSNSLLKDFTKVRKKITEKIDSKIRESPNRLILAINGGRLENELTAISNEIKNGLSTT